MIKDLGNITKVHDSGIVETSTGDKAPLRAEKGSRVVWDTIKKRLE